MVKYMQRTHNNGNRNRNVQQQGALPHLHPKEKAAVHVTRDT